MKKAEIIAIVVVVLVIALVWLGRTQFGVAPEPKPGEDLSKPADQERVVKEDAEVILSAFPSGFPVEAGAQTSDSYKYIPAKSLEQQSTLEYVSQKSLTENAKIFRDYLSKAGFQISNKTELPDLMFYYAQKGTEDLSVKIKTQDEKVSVSASYLRR